MQWKLPAGWKSWLEKYKYLVVVVLVGILLLLPSGTKKQSQTQVPVQTQQNYDPAELERKLEKVLSKIKGAGKVSVMLTVKDNGQGVYAQEVRIGEREQFRTPVIINGGSGAEQLVPVQTLTPTFQGALVVCSGGADPAVKLQLVQAIHALTGLSTEKITVCQSK